MKKKSKKPFEPTRSNEQLESDYWIIDSLIYQLEDFLDLAEHDKIEDYDERLLWKLEENAEEILRGEWRKHDFWSFYGQDIGLGEIKQAVKKYEDSENINCSFPEIRDVYQKEISNLEKAKDMIDELLIIIEGDSNSEQPKKTGKWRTHKSIWTVKKK